MPRWVKTILGVHMLTTYVIVILVGIEHDSIPFELSEIPLAALIISGLGSSVGLVLKHVMSVIGYSIKS